jgi:hypothetical protein
VPKLSGLRRDNNEKGVKAMKNTLIMGVCILLAGCKVTYTFENKSSFVVTVVPEYGDDFQIQVGAVKSFESSHKDMKLNYTPGGDYVKARKIASGHWEFTNGDFYFEANGKFLIYPPESWQLIDYPGLTFKAIFGPVDNDFAPNINFVEEVNPFSTFSTYINTSVNQIRGLGTNNITSEQFTTETGMDGIRIETNTEKLLQIYYLFDTGQEVFIATCSAPLQSDVDYATIFDNSVRTLEFLY